MPLMNVTEESSGQSPWRADDLVGAEAVLDRHHRRGREVPGEARARSARGRCPCSRRARGPARAARPGRSRRRRGRAARRGPTRGGPRRSARGRAPRGARAPRPPRPGRGARRRGCRSRRRRRRRPARVTAAPWCTSATNSSSSTSPRFCIPSSLTAASRSASCSSGTSRPSSAALIRIESSPLFLPSTIPRSAATSSEEYGSIDGGSWNWLATAPLSRAVERLAGDRLPRLERVAGELAHALGDGADPVEAEVRLDAVERAQRERDLAEVRVAGALAHAVDRPLDVRARPRARPRRRSRSRRRSRCGRGSAPARPARRARRSCRPAPRRPRARRCRACRRRRPRARPASTALE